MIAACMDRDGYDSSCLEEVCGACTLLINGKVSQACSALVDEFVVHNYEIIKGDADFETQLAQAAKTTREVRAVHVGPDVCMDNVLLLLTRLPQFAAEDFFDGVESGPPESGVWSDLA